jgi:hypothetical protein
MSGNLSSRWRWRKRMIDPRLSTANWRVVLSSEIEMRPLENVNNRPRIDCNDRKPEASRKGKETRSGSMRHATVMIVQRRRHHSRNTKYIGSRTHVFGLDIWEVED